MFLVVSRLICFVLEWVNCGPWKGKRNTVPRIHPPATEGSTHDPNSRLKRLLRTILQLLKNILGFLCLWAWCIVNVCYIFSISPSALCWLGRRFCDERSLIRSVWALYNQLLWIRVRICVCTEPIIVSRYCAPFLNPHVHEPKRPAREKDPGLFRPSVSAADSRSRGLIFFGIEC